MTLEAKIKFFYKFTESMGRINSVGEVQSYGAAYEVLFLKMYSLSWGRERPFEKYLNCMLFSIDGIKY